MATKIYAGPLLRLSLQTDTYTKVGRFKTNFLKQHAYYYVINELQKKALTKNVCLFWALLASKGTTYQKVRTAFSNKRKF